MNENDPRKPDLRLIHGGLHQSAALGAVRIVAAPEESQPFPVEAMTYEEDTFLIMSADPEEIHPEIHPVRLMMALEDFKPKKIGSVVVKKGRPLRLLAVIHDVNQEPTCRERWVEKALHAVFREVERRGIQSLGMPLLATRHGRMPCSRFARILNRVLTQTEIKSLKRLWIMAPVPDNRNFLKFFMDNLRLKEA